MKITDPIRQLLQEHGSISNIPEKDLQSHQLVRKFDEATGTWRILHLIAARNEARRAAATLSKFEGYLYAPYYEHLVDVREMRTVLLPDVIADAGKRAKALQNAGIPPIFDPDYFGSSAPKSIQIPAAIPPRVYFRAGLFPTVDFLIQFTIGVLDARRAAQGVYARSAFGNNVGRNMNLPIAPCSVSDIYTFCKDAFDIDRTLPYPLVLEMLHYTKENFEFSSQASEDRATANTEAAFRFVEQRLGPLAARIGRTSYKPWIDDLGVVNRPRWHLEYAPCDRDNIAKAYADSLKTMPTGLDYTVYKRMAATFPKIVPSPEELRKKLTWEAFISGCQTKDFRGVPPKAFEDPAVVRAVLAHFRRILNDWVRRDPEKLLTTVARAADASRVPRFCLSLDPFNTPFRKAQLRVLKRLTNAQFLQQLVHPRWGLQVQRFNGPSQATMAVRDYVRERFRTLNN